MQRIEAGHAGAVAVGRALIANPDLVKRWQGGHPENEPRPELFYTPRRGLHRYPAAPPGVVLAPRFGGFVFGSRACAHA
ncbi:hypothetical protein AB0L14_28230 [Streptomyces sp. NPDC052727]|uniref:hypothetical protein n=1 Tax=Streptomyces sp. NPDC052727 TaxID=3154854 RepID=UPI003444C746